MEKITEKPLGYHLFFRQRIAKRPAQCCKQYLNPRLLYQPREALPVCNNDNHI